MVELGDQQEPSTGGGRQMAGEFADLPFQLLRASEPGRLWQ
jgi:hypothetical protein